MAASTTPDGPPKVDAAPAGPARLHATVFNALTRGLADAGRFVALPEREDITRRIVRAAQLETAEQEPRPPRAGLRARYIDTIRGLSSPPMPAVFAEAFADALLAVRDEELDVLSDENDRLAKQVAAAGIEG